MEELCQSEMTSLCHAQKPAQHKMVFIISLIGFDQISIRQQLYNSENFKGPQISEMGTQQGPLKKEGSYIWTWFLK